MGLGNVTQPGEEQSDDNDQSNSKTQLVFWKYAAPKGYSGDDESNVEKAYRLCNGSGFLRNTLDASGQYEDLHALAAELMVGVEEVLRNGDFSDIMETIGPDAESILQYVEDNPEVVQPGEDEEPSEAQERLRRAFEAAEEQ